MASHGVVQFVYTLLAAARYNGAAVPVVGWEETEQPPDDVWLAVEEDYASERAVSIGAPSHRCLREEGSITVHVFASTSLDLADVRAFADAVRDLLRFKNNAGFGIRFTTVDPPNPMGLVDGLFSEYEVTLAYERDIFKP